MAIIIHRVSKNKRFSDAWEYYTYRHLEDQGTGHYEPVLDENGFLQLREQCATIYISSSGKEQDSELWASACTRVCHQYGKNLMPKDTKSHEYIISHSIEESPNITIADLLEEGRAFVRANLPGHEALISAHKDTDAAHVHISICSVRTEARTAEEWMMRGKNEEILPCETVAGGKHQCSPRFRRHINDWLLEYTCSHGFAARDNNSIADVHRQEKHGGKNALMRQALLVAAKKSRNMIDLQQVLKASFDMELKVSGTEKTISVLYPGNAKYVRLRTLGLSIEDLVQCFVGKDYIPSEEKLAAYAQRKREKEEKKQYIEWIRIRHIRNKQKAEELTEQAQRTIRERLRQKGERYDKSEFRDLNYLLAQSSYVFYDLETELEKLDRLLERWEAGVDENLSEQERERHREYVKWCGCNPDDPQELERLLVDREEILLQQGQATQCYYALSKTAEAWKGRNRITYLEKDLRWQKCREKELRPQLEYAEQRILELFRIADYCRKAVEDSPSMVLFKLGIEDFDLHDPKWDKFQRMGLAIFSAIDRRNRILRLIKELEERKAKTKQEIRDARREWREQQKGR